MNSRDATITFLDPLLTPNEILAVKQNGIIIELAKLTPTFFHVQSELDKNNIVVLETCFAKLLNQANLNKKHNQKYKQHLEEVKRKLKDQDAEISRLNDLIGALTPGGSTSTPAPDGSFSTPGSTSLHQIQHSLSSSPVPFNDPPVLGQASALTPNIQFKSPSAFHPVSGTPKTTVMGPIQDRQMSRRNLNSSIMADEMSFQLNLTTDAVECDNYDEPDPDPRLNQSTASSAVVVPTRRFDPSEDPLNASRISFAPHRSQASGSQAPLNSTMISLNQSMASEASTRQPERLVGFPDMTMNTTMNTTGCNMTIDEWWQVRLSVSIWLGIASTS